MATAQRSADRYRRRERARAATRSSRCRSTRQESLLRAIPCAVPHRIVRIPLVLRLRSLIHMATRSSRDSGCGIDLGCTLNLPNGKPMLNSTPKAATSTSACLNWICRRIGVIQGSGSIGLQCSANARRKATEPRTCRPASRTHTRDRSTSKARWGSFTTAATRTICAEATRRRTSTGRTCSSSTTTTNFPSSLPCDSSMEGKVADGWSVEGLVTLQSGQPYSVVDYSGAVGSIYYGI